MDKIAFGTALGTVFGLLLFLATIWLLIKGGPVIGPRLGLLGQFFFGYTVTVDGAFVGLIYGFLVGFGIGWFFAFFRNLFFALYLYRIKKIYETRTLRDFFNHM